MESDHLYRPCFGCKRLLNMAELIGNLFVCHHCQYHFRIGCKQRAKQLSNSFEELFPNISPVDVLNFEDTELYTERLIDAQEKTELTDAVLTGVGEMDGQRIALALFDFDFMGGSLGSVVGEKICRLTEYAIENELPLVLLISSSGSRIQEGIFSLMQLAKINCGLDNLRAHGLLQITVLTEPSFGAALFLGMHADIIISEPGTRSGYAGRKIIEQTIRKQLPIEFQTAEFQLRNGNIDMIVERKRLKSTVSKLVSMHAKPAKAV